MSTVHPIFSVQPGGTLRIDSRELRIEYRRNLENPFGISRALLWTGGAQSSHFLMASGPNYFEPEIFGYTPVEITFNGDSFSFQGIHYTPVHSEHERWGDEEGKIVSIYDCMADTGATILAVQDDEGVRGFAYRTRYNWQNVVG